MSQSSSGGDPAEDVRSSFRGFVTAAVILSVIAVLPAFAIGPLMGVIPAPLGGVLSVIWLGVIPAGWLICTAGAIRTGGWRGAWLLLTAPLALTWPGLVVAFVYSCTTGGGCL